jgi:predicted aldo/keto reductase-like oxidoreductase
VDLPGIFRVYNEAIMYNRPDRARMIYNQWIAAEKRADHCLQCGECEAQCPQKIAIIEWLEKADRYLVAARA